MNYFKTDLERIICKIQYLSPIKGVDKYEENFLNILWGCISSNLYKIFRLRGSTKCLWGPIFRGWNEILLLGKALKLGVIFQKSALKLTKKIEKYWEIREKCKLFRNFFNFRAGHKFLIIGKIKILTWTCYNGGHFLYLGGGAAEPPEGIKNFRKFLEIGNVKFNNFTKIAWIICTELDKIIRRIENFIRPGCSGGVAPRRYRILINFL